MNKILELKLTDIRGRMDDVGYLLRQSQDMKVRLMGANLQGIAHQIDMFLKEKKDETSVVDN